MSKKSDRHVVPSRRADGTLSPRGPAGELPSRHAASRDRSGPRIVRNEGGGEVVIHDRRNLIRDSDTVAPGRDPYPPRDRR